MTEPITASAEALVDNASRLGLTWDLKPATVITSDTSVRPAVQVDGDTVALSANSMVGPLLPGERVYCLVVPPSGLFVVGFANVGNGRLLAWGARSAASSPITGTEAGSVLLQAECPGGATYRVSTGILAVSSTTNEAVAFDVALRYEIGGTIASTSSALGAIWRVVTFAGSGTGFATLHFDVHCPSTIDLSVLLTGKRITGANNMTLASSTGGGPRLFIEAWGANMPPSTVDKP